MVYYRNLKNSKAKWVNLREERASNALEFKIDEIMGVATFDSLRNTAYPKTRMALPYVFTHFEKRLEICNF
jgi:hypothetical protein